MGLFGRKNEQQIEELRTELAALRDRLESTEVAKTELEDQIGELHGANSKLRDELLVQITVASNAATDAHRSLTDQTTSQLDEHRARLADLAVVATDAAERADRLDALRSDVTRRLESAEQRAATTDERLSATERLAVAADKRAGAVDARLTQIATELANQLTELGNELDAVAADGDDADTDEVLAEIDPELLAELLDAQERLASEQARYQIAFRQDLAELADRFKRQR
ncbi:MAG: hypothetical protein AAFP84_13670 [Actinomycetota bacterium]